MLDKMLQLPYDSMMARFLSPLAVEPDTAQLKNAFDEVPVDLRSCFYKPLTNALNTHVIGHNGPFIIGVTDLRIDADHTGSPVHLGMYSKGSAVSLSKRGDCSNIELSIVCESEDELDPFDDGSSIDTLSRRDDVQDPYFSSCDSSSEKTTPRTFLDHIMDYTEVVFQQQQRTHYYTAVIFGQHARIARWDRSGCVYSDKFDYKAEPGKLTLFIWRLSHAATPDIRGHDLSATRVLVGSPEHQLMVDAAQLTAGNFANPAGDHARGLFAKSLVTTWPWWKLTIPNDDAEKTPHEYLVAEPTFAAPGVVGRGTRGYVALDYTDPNHPFVYLKDCWRVVHDRSEQEGSILTYLNAKGVRNVPTALRHGDVGQAITVARDVWMELHPRAKEECRLKNHRHYRLVVKEVGQPLQSFKNGRELVWIVLNAFTAHEDAYKLANTIHRDISVGNILIMRDPTVERFGCYGLLTDWELSKRTDQQDLEPRHPDRTGTWQFMSVNALGNPGKEIGIPDELESLFHVLLYCSIRRLPHNCGEVGDFMDHYFDQGQPVNALREEYVSSEHKRLVLLTGELVAPNQSPIVFLLAPLPDPPAKAVSLATNSNTSDSPSPSRPSTPNPSSRSQLKGKPVPDPTIEKKDRHPIDHTLNQLLELFRARYELQKRSRAVPDSEHKRLVTINKAPKTKMLSAYLDAYTKKLASNAPPTNNQMTLKDLEVNAAKLETHEEVGSILTEAAFELNGTPWPECDKTPDQLDPNYRADKEKKEDTKLGKRSTPDDGTQAESKPKRSRRSAPSRT